MPGVSMWMLGESPTGYESCESGMLQRKILFAVLDLLAVGRDFAIIADRHRDFVTPVNFVCVIRFVLALVKKMFAKRDHIGARAQCAGSNSVDSPSGVVSF